MRFVLVILLAAGVGAQVKRAEFEKRPALLIENDKLELLVFPQGGALVSLTLRDDAEKTNPMWNPIRYAREVGRDTFGASVGHFVCVDGFGPVSAEERDAGMPGHGEAHRQAWETKLHAKQGTTSTLTQTAVLPGVRETLTRTIRLVDGENVVSVVSELASDLPFDRPVVWAEHATIGSPFLDPGQTVVDLGGVQSETRVYPNPAGAGLEHRFAQGKEFKWPNAPGAKGGKIDARLTPKTLGFGEHTTTRMDPSRAQAWVTALHPGKKLLLGYVWRREDFPWMQSWEHYPADGRLARGLEFSTQPYDVPRRDAISLGRKFDTPTYRWLPGKGKIEARWLMFWTRVPEGMTRVDDVRLESGQIVIEDRKGKKRVSLAASRGL